uniref:RNA-directed DNA polymerase, eukaryota n=1 Tax=Tanacetum cinerariifolium TaxID=118510 RepID=A0A6L2M419_TANCI|nr:RNA-directed DNA polymerase, eukaryota [Tanacetum cinerariifolium]
MYSQRSKEDQVARISKSVFVTNFSDNFGYRDLWKLCEAYGNVVDVFIPNRKSKAGKRFAFVRFIRVVDLVRLIGNLCTLWVGRFHLHANAIRYERPCKPINSVRNSLPKEYNKSASYASAVKDFQAPVGHVASSFSSPALVLDDYCIIERDLSRHAMGRVKDLNFIPNLQSILTKEGFPKVKLSYLGGMWVLLELGYRGYKKEIASAHMSEFLDFKHSEYTSDDESPLGTKSKPVDQQVCDDELVGESDDEGVSETLFGDKPSSSCNNNVVEEDPSLSHPPGFTPEVSQQADNHNSIPQKENSTAPAFYGVRYGRAFERHRAYHCDSVGNSGGILCVWEESIFKRDYVSISDNFIAIYRTWLPNNSELLIVVIYAPQSPVLKRILWDYISGLISYWNGEVIVMGDFNAVCSEDERFGSLFNPFCARDFNQYISSFGLMEIKTEGYSFMWSHPSATKMSKLDRFLVSEGIISDFPSIMAVCLDRHLSDHCPILLREIHTDFGLCPFKKKLQDLKKIIRCWIKDKNIAQAGVKKAIIDDLVTIDKNLDSGVVSDEMLLNRMDLTRNLNDLKQSEVKDFVQKAKVKWAIEGDEKSKFFHGLINKKRSQLSIREVFVDGDWRTDPKVVKDTFKEHFATRFKQPVGSRFKLNISFPKRLSNDQVEILDSCITRAEIRDAVWECGANKSPGPDGYTFEFFRRYWSLIGPIFAPLPISLIGSVYKVITKILANRLAVVISDLVSDTQSAFVANRQILDRPFVLNELLACSAMASILINGRPTSELSLFCGEWSDDNLGNLLRILKCFYLASGFGKDNNEKDKIRAKTEQNQEQTKRVGQPDKSKPEAGSSFTYDPIPESFNKVQIIPNLPPQSHFNIYLCQICESNSHYEKRIEEEQAAIARYWKIPACCDDDDDYNSAITPVLSTEEPDNSLSMGDEHLDTILATESDEVIKSSVENLVPIPSEFKGIPDTMCDVHLVNNPTPLEAKDHFEIVINSNDDISSSDDDSFYNKNIEYVEASPHNSELVSLEVAEIVIPEEEEIEDDNLRENLLNETNTFENSLPEFKNFYFDLEEISSGSTTTHSDISLSEYDSFIFDLSNDQFPPTDRSDFTHEEFADELAHIISPPELLPKDVILQVFISSASIGNQIDPHHFNAESDLIESLLNHDSSIISSSSKIDSLFDEFVGELTLFKSISLEISETDWDHENEIRLTKRLLYDNSSPRPPEEFVSKNSNADVESFSPYHIPVEDSDSFIEEIDLSFTSDDPMPPGIEEDDYDSERDILILEELLDNHSLSLPEYESFHFDTPSSSCPPAKQPDGNTGILNIKMMGDISKQKVPMPRLMITRVSNQEKFPDLISHQGLENF